MKIKVCIFEDDDTSREVLKDIVMMLGYEVRAFSNPCEFGNVADVKRMGKEADIVITDNFMPKMTGIELVTHLIHAGFDMKNIAIISGYWTHKNLEITKYFRIQTFRKPVSAVILKEWLETRKIDLAND